MIREQFWRGNADGGGDQNGWLQAGSALKIVALHSMLLRAFQSAPACERATANLYHDVKEQEIRLFARTCARTVVADTLTCMHFHKTT